MGVTLDMRTIWKFTAGEGPVDMPRGAEIIKVGLQDGGMQRSKITLWAIVDPEAPVEQRSIVMLGTGFEQKNSEMASLTYLDSVFDGPFVWHIFDGGPVI